MSRPKPKSGETYETPDGTCRVRVRRVAGVLRNVSPTARAAVAAALALPTEPKK